MSVFALALIFVAFVILAVTLTFGIVTGRGGWAAATVLAETDTRAERLQQLHLSPGVRPQRLDRHDAYIWLHMGLWLVGLGFVIAPAPNTALASLSWDAQKALGLCIVTGSTVALLGVCLGLRLPGGCRVVRSITNNMLSGLLGDDIRIPYTFGSLGLLSVGVSMCGYAWTIYQYATLVGTLAGGLTFAIGGMCLTMSIKFIVRIRRYIRRRDALLAEVVTRIDERDA